MQIALAKPVWWSGSIRNASAAPLALILATSCTGTATDSNGQTERVARPLAASFRPTSNEDPNARKRLLLPEPERSDDEIRQQGFEAIETAFRKSWTEGSPDYVVEGTVTSASAEI